MSRAVSSRTALAAPVAAALRRRTGPGWVAERAAALGDGGELLERRELPGGGVELVVSRRLPAGAPGFLARFVPADGRVRQSERWAGPDASGTAEGTWSAVLPGAPASLHGTCRVEPEGGGSRLVVTGTVQVRLPLVGSRAEAYLAEQLTRLLDREGALLATALGAGVGD